MLDRLEVLTVANPALHEKARPVEPEEFGPEMVKYGQKLMKTMRESNGAGLAAPQVGDGRRILVMLTETDGAMLMANPVIRQKSGRLASTKEGCLSIPGERVSVKRSDAVEVSYMDSMGSECLCVLTGFLSAVVQHEIDHLDGITLLDKMKHYNRRRYLKRLGVDAKGVMDAS
jgi:peptide deformylase